jgi:Zn-dependent peptidase ImmA (M78 family)
MRRGFKTWSEEQATAFRLALNLRPDAPLPAERLAEHLGVLLITPSEVPGITEDLLDALLTNDTSGWSAVTVQADDLAVVVYNISHSLARRESDLMHELAHIICQHPAIRIVQVAGLPVREYSDIQEEEAAWLGGALHLPRIALWNAFKQRLSVPTVMARFNASEQMVRYRRNVTGIDVQLARVQR